MSTRRLIISENHQVTNLKSTAKPVHVEVPAGESEYRIFEHQKAGESAEYIFHLRHSHSQVLVVVQVEARGESVPHLKTAVIHHAPNTKSDTQVRTLSRDSAFPHYEGIIVIEEGANQSESYLNHHSLLLGSSAKSWTLPSLEIKANDVKLSLIHI